MRVGDHPSTSVTDSSPRTDGMRFGASGVEPRARRGFPGEVFDRNRAERLRHEGEPRAFDPLRASLERISLLRG
jgi:hypothetical protein